MECRCIIGSLNEDRELMAGSILAVHRDLLCQLFRRVQSINLRITTTTLQLIGPGSIGLYNQSAVAAWNSFTEELTFVLIGVDNIQCAADSSRLILNCSLLGPIAEDRFVRPTIEFNVPIFVGY